MIQLTLGIDIGGTNTVFGLLDKEGNLKYNSSLPTNSEKPINELLKKIQLDIQNYVNATSETIEIVGIGVGAPNSNYYSGMLENPPNLKWGSINLKQVIGDMWRLPSAITNDANAAALGEMYYGAAKKMKNFVEITLGTGLGSGIIVDGKLVYGNDGFAGEMGHVTVKRGGRKCGCGRNGCLETYASATGIRNTVFELLANTRNQSPLRNITFSELTAKKIYEAAVKGDFIALEAFRFTAKMLGEAFSNATAYLSPQAFILFGGLSSAGALLVDEVKRSMEENLLAIYKNKVQVILSQLPQGKAAILGAGALIWNELT